MENKVARLHQGKNKIIILEGFDFMWDIKKIDEVIELWNNGTPLQEMVCKAKRREEELFLLLLHLSLKGRIKKRGRGIWGN
jgi:hypothetical protein